MFSVFEIDLWIQCLATSCDPPEWKVAWAPQLAAAKKRTPNMQQRVKLQKCCSLHRMSQVNCANPKMIQTPMQFKSFMNHRPIGRFYFFLDVGCSLVVVMPSVLLRERQASATKTTIHNSFPHKNRPPSAFKTKLPGFMATCWYQKGTKGLNIVTWYIKCKSLYICANTIVCTYICTFFCRLKVSLMHDAWCQSHAHAWCKVQLCGQLRGFCERTTKALITNDNITLS